LNGVVCGGGEECAFCSCMSRGSLAPAPTFSTRWCSCKASVFCSHGIRSLRSRSISQIASWAPASRCVVGWWSRRALALIHALCISCAHRAVQGNFNYYFTFAFQLTSLSCLALITRFFTNRSLLPRIYGSLFLCLVVFLLTTILVKVRKIEIEMRCLDDCVGESLGVWVQGSV
jgi:hypothetical protein